MVKMMNMLRRSSASLSSSESHAAERVAEEGRIAIRPYVKGFTLIELMVVMTIIALLLTLAVPRYFHSIDKAREATLHQDLVTMRDAIDKFHGDNGHYPGSLEELVSRKYLLAIPPDPITGDASTWVIVNSDSSSEPGVYDVRSGAPGTAADGSRYGDW